MPHMCNPASAHQLVTSLAADAAGDGTEEATAFDYRAHWKSLFFPALDSFSEYVVVCRNVASMLC